MDNKNTNVIIDLGSHEIKCALFKNEDNKNIIVASSKIKTSGISNSIITNFEDAKNSIKIIIANLEKKTNLEIDNVTVLIEPIQIITTSLTNFKKMNGDKIETTDINFLLRESKKQLEQNDDKLTQIHMFNYKYILDNNLYKNLPINISCDQFSLENIFVSVPKNIIKNITNVFDTCNIKINKFILPSYANGLFLFNNDQLEAGCAMIDIGFEKTSIALFKNLSLIKTITLPFGSNHISKDISKICYLKMNEAEKIKIDFSSEQIYDEYLSKKYFKESTFRKIPIKLIKDIIGSRIQEMLNLIKKNIDEVNESFVNKNNFLLVGGGSKILDLSNNLNLVLFNNLFSNQSSISNQSNNESYLNCISGQNLFINGWSTEAVALPMKNQKKGFFAKFFNIFG